MEQRLKSMLFKFSIFTTNNAQVILNDQNVTTDYPQT